MPQMRPSDSPDRSPLESIMGSRASIASEASGELGILDSFPLPAGIIPPSPQNSPDSSNSSIVRIDPSIEAPVENTSLDPLKSSKLSPYPVLATEQRYRRYGHHYQLSNDSDLTEVGNSSQTSMSSGESDENKLNKRKNTPSPLKLAGVSSTPQRRYQFPNDSALTPSKSPSNISPRLANQSNLQSNPQLTNLTRINTATPSNVPPIPPMGVQSAPPSATVASVPSYSGFPQASPIEATSYAQKSPAPREIRSPTSARSQFLPNSRRYHHTTSLSAHSILPSDGSPSKPAVGSVDQPLVTASWQLESNQAVRNSSLNTMRFPSVTSKPESGDPENGSPGPKLIRPRVSRAHSVSQSWDAGNPVRSNPAPFPMNLPPVIPPALPGGHSFEDHIKIGVNLMVFNHNMVLAHRHWESAAAPPLNSVVGMLLLVLGHSERWFPPGLLVSPIVADPHIDFQQPGRTVGLVVQRLPRVAELQSLVGPILPRVVDAIRSYADKLLARQLDLEALEFLELSGNLGSAQSLMTAASIYYKGTRRVRKDIGRSTRLFERASKLT